MNGELQLIAVGFHLGLALGEHAQRRLGLVAFNIAAAGINVLIWWGKQ